MRRARGTARARAHACMLIVGCLYAVIAGAIAKGCVTEAAARSFHSGRLSSLDAVHVVWTARPT